MKMVHGGDIYTAREQLNKPIIDFSANINPLGIQQSVKDAICGCLEECENYPDPLNRKLRAAISAFEHVPAEYILCGNGSADLIFRVVYAIKPRKALLLAPTFAEYECALRNTDTQIVYHKLREENDFCLTEEILGELTPDLDILFICNPNNPTGRAADSMLMKKITEACATQGIRLVVDECFMDFITDWERFSIKSALSGYPNLLILKAFTKTFAIPGIRLGYALCADKGFLELISAAGQPWSVSVIAEHAGIAALSDPTHIVKTAETVSAERAYLSAELKKFNLSVYDSLTNYLMFSVDQPIDLKGKLFAKGILIRSCANYRGLDERYYRIAVKAHADNEILVQAMREILEGNA